MLYIPKYLSKNAIKRSMTRCLIAIRSSPIGDPKKLIGGKISSTDLPDSLIYPDRKDSSTNMTILSLSSFSSLIIFVNSSSFC